MATMESLIGLVNKIQRACTALGDHGGEGMSLWEALPSVAVVGGQVSIFSQFYICLFIDISLMDFDLVLCGWMWISNGWIYIQVW